MASITDRSDSETYEGRTPESIVRRIWGRGAELYGRDRVGTESVTDVYTAQVTRRDRHGTHVVAHVVVRP